MTDISARPEQRVQFNGKIFDLPPGNSYAIDGVSATLQVRETDVLVVVCDQELPEAILLRFLRGKLKRGVGSATDYQYAVFLGDQWRPV